MEIEELITTLRDAVRDLPKKYENNADDIRDLEHKTTDYLHYFELVDLNASEGFRAYKDLQQIQKDRRALKDENELLKHVYPLLKSLRGNLSQMDKAIGEIRKSKGVMKKRKYRCRSAKELEDKINGKTT